MHASDRRSYSLLELAILVLFAAIAVAGVVSTYSVFNQTWDEPMHVASGMEWLQYGTYTYEDLHPPLARIAVAAGPYLSGIRLSKRDQKPEEKWTQGNELFAARGNYLHNLALARLGVLPFFFLALGIVWYWTRRLFGKWTAVAAAGLFTLLPPVLGHASLATTDLPLTATLVLALYAFTRWLERPATRQSLLLGMAAGLAILTKFSAVLFLPACCAAVLLCWLFARDKPTPRLRQGIMPRLKQLALATLILAAAVLACYRFSFDPMILPGERPHLFLDRLLGQQGRWHDLAYHLAETTPFPVPQFIHGISTATSRVSSPENMYLLGQVRTRGWWYFFPVALAVKTPIAFLILTMLGAVAVIRRWRKKGHDWQVLTPLAAALSLLLVCLPIKFNIGLRHILPIYAFLSMLAGFGLTELWHVARARWLGRVLAGGLAGWMVLSTGMAHPDYLAYFNEFADSHPERILVDSDLDWGQDLRRLSADLRTRGVTHVAIAYNGTADLSIMNLPSFKILAPCEHATGWIAVSLYKLQMSMPSVGCGGYSWLEAYEPAALIGKSIRLYRIPGTGEATTPLSTVKPGR